MDIHMEKEINASADKVWNILAHQFAEIGEWADGVKWSRALEASEVPEDFVVAPQAPVPGRVTPNPFGDLKEILTRFSDVEREFTFEVSGLPKAVAHTQNTTRVIETGADTCLVTFDVQMVLRGPLKLLSPILRRRLKTSGFGPAGALEALKPYAETGQISEKKQSRQSN